MLVRQLQPKEPPPQGSGGGMCKRPLEGGTGAVSQGARDTHSCSPCSLGLRRRQVP